MWKQFHLSVAWWQHNKIAMKVPDWETKLWKRLVEKQLRYSCFVVYKKIAIFISYWKSILKYIHCTFIKIKLINNYLLFPLYVRLGVRAWVRKIN